MPELKLLALDEEDLQVISAYTQDAVVRVGDMGFAKSDKRFACLMNRFAWEEGVDAGKRQRHRAAMHFDHVTDVNSVGINLSSQDGILDLLSIDFTQTKAPEGIVKLLFAGGGTVELSVDCLEVRMSDLGASWAAKATPAHQLDKS